MNAAQSLACWVRTFPSSPPSGESIPDLEQSLDRFGPTFRSRLYEMCKVVELRADDFRKAVQQASYRFHAE